MVRAYSVNLLGSIIGVWVMAVLAFNWLPPVYWIGLAGSLLLICRWPTWKSAAICILIMAGGLLGLNQLGLTRNFRSNLATLRTGEARIFWSPYQKLRVSALGDGEYFVHVNNTGYMSVYNLSPDFLQRHPEVASHYRQSSYDAPFAFVRERHEVLVVGAGGGNDVAAALRNGAEHVDAVEIDPLILSIGEKINPGHPYSSPRVRRIINDARNFMRTAQRSYDIIIFGLLDSHTQFSDFSNMRVDNYVYTEESFRQARRLLKPNGVLMLKFEVRYPWEWMGQRFYAMLNHVFGRPPVTFFAPPIQNMTSATVFLESDDSNFWARAQAVGIRPEQKPNFPLQTTGAPAPTTDDWPYVYHRAHRVPRTYFTVSVILLGLTLLLVRGSFRPRQSYTRQFFFLGAGFLLLETQLVSRLALYFGTTWVVNSVAITAILIVLVLANGYVARFRPQRLGLYYVPLVVTLLANYIFPWEGLPFGATTVGILLSAAYAIPVFFAGVLFTESFRRTAEKANAFGANIVGAVAGGLAQNMSFILGMKALLLSAAAFYVAAALFEETARPVSAEAGALSSAARA